MQAWKPSDMFPDFSPLADGVLRQLASANAPSPVANLFIILLAGVIIASVVKQKRLSGGYNLAKGERARTIMQQWLDPLIVLLLVGTIMYADLMDGGMHVVLAVVGTVVGIGAGLFRGRRLYVRAMPVEKVVVIKHTTIEIIVLFVLVALKIFAQIISDDPQSILNLVATALIFLDLGESVARAAYITWRYQQELQAFAATSPPANNPA